MLTWLESILFYHPETPMIFTRSAFWWFFAAVLAGYTLVYQRLSWRNAYLFFVSLFFYYKTAGLFVLLLFFSTLADYAIARQIPAASERTRPLWLWASVLLNLGVLAYFKYAYFFTDTYNALFQTDLKVFNFIAHWANGFLGTRFNVEHIILPIGISFFTFQKLSYVVDVYRKELAPLHNLLDFGFFVTFFPQLVAGPIVRATTFIPQMQKPYQLSEREFGVALFLILKGLTKKMLVSDFISVNFIDRVFAHPSAYTGFEALMACYGYSLQVYCDFSGYTDIAIGLSQVMGFRLPANFNEPHKAENVADFWRRWHISLSTWLRDYLYIPLGGNRYGEWRTNLNIMLTMLLGGLWHGASWNFVIWGGLNGLALLFYRYWRRISPIKDSTSPFVTVVSVLLTFSFITFTRIFFRAESLELAFEMLQKLAGGIEFALIPSVVSGYAAVFSVMALGFFWQWMPLAWKESGKDFFVRTPVYAKAAIAALTIFALYQAISADMQPFIYFQF
ncbi:MAG: MBOAT family O-acyltransferase [Chloroherpetonaceae bacterium]|nr:MBOAT family O-acyltransferase [Chloroherpetonaceae bacterium]